MVPLLQELLAIPLDGKIVVIMHILNDSLSDVVQSDETRILYGRDYFYETLLGLQFKVSTFSFFQPNSLAAEVLYSVVRDYIGDTRNQEVFDLYSGTGTIAQLAAAVAKEVIGVEIVEEAVIAARENAQRNGLTNCRFIAGDVLKVLDELSEKRCLRFCLMGWKILSIFPVRLQVWREICRHFLMQGIGWKKPAVWTSSVRQYMWKRAFYCPR